MKRRDPIPEKTTRDNQDALCRALLSLDSPKLMRAFLHDLCTPAELEALSDRWRVVPLILGGMPYRDIHEHTGVSITTIGRVARCLHEGQGGYAAAVERRVADQSSSDKSRSRA